MFCMQSAQVVYLCEPVLLWLNASLCFHMQFTEDIYLRVNQTTQQNTTQENKTFICKLSRRQDKRQQTKRSAKPSRSSSCLTAPVKRDEYAGYNVDEKCRFPCDQFSKMLVLARLWPRWMYIGGQGRWDGPVAGNGTHQYVKWGVAVEAGRLIQALEREGVGTCCLASCGGQQPSWSASASASSALQCSWSLTSCVLQCWFTEMVQCIALLCTGLASSRARSSQLDFCVPPPPAIMHHSAITSIPRKYQLYTSHWSWFSCLSIRWVIPCGEKADKVLFMFRPHSGYVPSVFYICVLSMLCPCSGFVLVMFWLYSVYPLPNIPSMFHLSLCVLFPFHLCSVYIPSILHLSSVYLPVMFRLRSDHVLLKL